MEVTVTLGEFTVEMSDTSLPANTPITFIVTNNGATVHEVVLEPAGAVNQPLEQNGQELELEDIAPGETVTATWVIPEPGNYQLGCHIAGHYEAGMVGLFTVVAQADATATSSPTSVATVAATSVATATVAAEATATPSTVLPVTGGTGNLPAFVVLGGLGVLLIASGLLLRRRLT